MFTTNLCSFFLVLAALFFRDLPIVFLLLLLLVLFFTPDALFEAPTHFEEQRAAIKGAQRVAGGVALEQGMGALTFPPTFLMLGDFNR